MLTTTRFLPALVLALACVAKTAAQQPAPPAQPARNVSVITIPTMDCSGCAKKINAQLQAVPGVAQVTMNLEAHQLFVTPQPNVGVSPKLMWEATEKAGFAPTKLETPYGVFNAKPQQ